MAVLRVYGDAGGNRDKSNIALGAYLGSVQQWDKRYKPLWTESLQKEGVECFHRSEMEPPFHGEFARKGWTTEHQIEVLNRLHSVLKKYTIVGMGQAVSTEAFSRLVPMEIRKDFGAEYGLCVLRTIVWFGTRARKSNDWIYYSFEAGDLGQRQINRLIESLYRSPIYREIFRIAGWTFADKRGPCGIIQLQSADFIAFEAYKSIENYLAGLPRPPRKSYFDLVRERHDVVMLWTEEAIRKWVDRLNECNGNVIESLIVQREIAK
jgi:hypothetical protein